MKLNCLHEMTLRDLLISEQLDDRQKALLAILTLIVARQGKDNYRDVVNDVKNAAEPRYQQAKDKIRQGEEGKQFGSQLYGRQISMILKGPPIEAPTAATESIDIQEALEGQSDALPAHYQAKAPAPEPAPEPKKRKDTASVVDIMKAIGLTDENINDIVSRHGLDTSKNYSLGAAQDLLRQSGGDPAAAAETALQQAQSAEVDPAAAQEPAAAPSELQAPAPAPEAPPVASPVPAERPEAPRTMKPGIPGFEKFQQEKARAMANVGQPVAAATAHLDPDIGEFEPESPPPVPSGRPGVRPPKPMRRMSKLEKFRQGQPARFGTRAREEVRKIFSNAVFEFTV